MKFFLNFQHFIYTIIVYIAYDIITVYLIFSMIFSPFPIFVSNWINITLLVGSFA